MLICHTTVMSSPDATIAGCIKFGEFEYGIPSLLLKLHSLLHETVCASSGATYVSDPGTLEPVRRVESLSTITVPVA